MNLGFLHNGAQGREQSAALLPTACPQHRALLQADAFSSIHLAHVAGAGGLCSVAAPELSLVAASGTVQAMHQKLLLQNDLGM